MIYLILVPALYFLASVICKKENADWYLTSAVATSIMFIIWMNLPLVTFIAALVAVLAVGFAIFKWRAFKWAPKARTFGDFVLTLILISGLVYIRTPWKAAVLFALYVVTERITFYRKSK